MLLLKLTMRLWAHSLLVLVLLSLITRAEAKIDTGNGVGAGHRTEQAVAKFATSPNAKTILFPIEATQLIGSLGGIGELVREAIKPGEGAATLPPPPAGVPVPSVRQRTAVPRTGGEE